MNTPLKFLRVLGTATAILVIGGTTACHRGQLNACERGPDQEMANQRDLKTTEQGNDSAKTNLANAKRIAASNEGHSFGSGPGLATGALISQQTRTFDGGLESQIATLDGQVFVGVFVLGVKPDGLSIRHTLPGGGIGWTTLKFSNLPESIQRRYASDAARAAEQEEEQFRASAEWNVRLHENEGNGKNVKIVSEILADYHQKHTYLKDDAFVCLDMACDVWNMVKTRGIEARIQVGNINRDITSLSEADHVWVVAEISPGKWLALETTAGCVVYRSENERYYGGWRFDNPKQLKEAYYGRRGPR